MSVAMSRTSFYVASMPVTSPARGAVREFAEAVALGLSDTPRWIPSRFLYDARGSQLFEAICDLPEYYLTRAEASILRREAKRFRELTGPVTLVELGSGSAVKTDHLLRAYAAGGKPVQYVPVDVSASILRMAAERIEETFPSVNVEGVHGEYERAFPLLDAYAPALLLFLGSTIGNFNHAESLAFWRRVAQAMPAGSWVLLGADLVKDAAELEAAYNDAAGVTAAFTRNLFARMNAELGAGLDLDAIEHEAVWNPEWQRIEIGARFRRAQTLDVTPLGRRFAIAAGDLVLTEISRKFVLDHLQAYLDCFGFETVHAARDDRERFGVLLLRRKEDPRDHDD
jgi:L-histidine N-alpha-methyltransferase